MKRLHTILDQLITLLGMLAMLGVIISGGDSQVEPNFKSALIFLGAFLICVLLGTINSRFMRRHRNVNSVHRSDNFRK